MGLTPKTHRVQVGLFQNKPGSFKPWPFYRFLQGFFAMPFNHFSQFYLFLTVP